MNIRIACILLCLLSKSFVQAQLNIPLIRELAFADVAADLNTYSDKHAPLSFLSGFTLNGDEALLAKNPIEVMFNPVYGVHRDECRLLRWDPVIRVWTAFSGNALRQTRDGSALYWTANVATPGTYALMKDLAVAGKTRLDLPAGHKVEHWKYVQSNIGVVCEGHVKASSLSIPLPSVSPVAELSMRCRVDGNQIAEYALAPVGTLVKQLWRDASLQDATYKVEFASHRTH